MEVGMLNSSLLKFLLGLSSAYLFGILPITQVAVAQEKPKIGLLFAGPRDPPPLLRSSKEWRIWDTRTEKRLWLSFGTPMEKPINCRNSPRNSSNKTPE